MKENIINILESLYNVKNLESYLWFSQPKIKGLWENITIYDLDWEILYRCRTDFYIQLLRENELKRYLRRFKI